MQAILQCEKILYTQQASTTKACGHGTAMKMAVDPLRTDGHRRDLMAGRGLRRADLRRQDAFLVRQLSA
ncbi:MAG: hypothetical protein CL535_15535 [Ahrensia sp.]|nr:hypothetical protein [Ahrensia sp.]